MTELVGASNRTFSYEYDHQSQIRRAADDRGYLGRYDYTPAGRILTVDLDVVNADVPSRDVTYDYDDLDPERLVAMLDRQTGADVVRLSHDPAGNTTSKLSGAGTGNFTYDGDGRLRIAVRNGERERYYYDTNGRRVLAIRTLNGTNVETRRNFEDLEVETRSGVTTTRLTVKVGTPVARVVNGSEIQYLHHNATGNLLIGAHGFGGMRAGFSYGAFGEILEQQSDAAGFERRYQDRERDTISGWYDYGVRLYDPETMLWNRSDPLFRFAPEYAGAEPRRLGLYTFSLNNPLRYVDPDGRDPYDNQENDVPPEVAAQKGIAAGDVMAEAFVHLLPVAHQALKSVDVIGITDVAEVAHHLMNGNWGAAAEGGAWIAAAAATGWAAGRVLKVGGKIGRKVLGKADDAGEFAAGLGRHADDAGEAAGGGGWDAESMAASVPRSGNRTVIGQGVGTTTCATKCVEMAMDTMGAQVDRAALQPFVDMATKRPGLPNQQIAEAFHGQGVKAEARRFGGISQLEAVTARGTPVIALATSHGSRTGVHAIVVDGVTTKPELGKVVAVRDPAGKGSQFFLRADTFLKKWTGEVTIPIKDWLP